MRFVETHRLSAFQAALQRGETDLLLFNPNSEETPLDKERPLRLWLSPDTDRARLLAIKGMVEKHYTAERLNLYLDGSEVKLKGKSPLVREVEKEANRQLDDKFAGINAYVFHHDSALQRNGDGAPDQHHHPIAHGAGAGGQTDCRQADSVFSD